MHLTEKQEKTFTWYLFWYLSLGIFFVKALVELLFWYQEKMTLKCHKKKKQTKKHITQHVTKETPKHQVASEKQNEKHGGFRNTDILADIVRGFRSVCLCCVKAALKQHTAENK